MNGIDDEGITNKILREVSKLEDTEESKRLLLYALRMEVQRAQKVVQINIK